MSRINAISKQLYQSLLKKFIIDHTYHTLHQAGDHYYIDKYVHRMTHLVGPNSPILESNNNKNIGIEATW